MFERIVLAPLLILRVGIRVETGSQLELLEQFKSGVMVARRRVSPGPSHQQ